MRAFILRLQHQAHLVTQAVLGGKRVCQDVTTRNAYRKITPRLAFPNDLHLHSVVNPETHDSGTKNMNQDTRSSAHKLGREPVVEIQAACSLLPVPPDSSRTSKPRPWSLQARPLAKRERGRHGERATRVPPVENLPVSDTAEAARPPVLIADAHARPRLRVGKRGQARAPDIRRVVLRRPNAPDHLARPRVTARVLPAAVIKGCYAERIARPSAAEVARDNHKRPPARGDIKHDRPEVEHPAFATEARV